MTETLIKYVLLDIQPNISFKEYVAYSLVILEGVLRIVLLVDNQKDTESINTNQFFLSLVQDIKDRDEAHTDHETCDET
jgi:hypothetical protein